MYKLLTIAVLSLLFTQCNENIVYENHIDPSGNLEWNKEEIVVHDVEIIDTSINYSISLALRYAVGYAYPVCKVLIKETSPSGIVNEEKFAFMTRNENGYIGEAGGDIIDLELPWKSERKFKESGVYHYEIFQDMEDPKIHMVMEVGMVVTKISMATNQ